MRDRFNRPRAGIFFLFHFQIYNGCAGTHARVLDTIAQSGKGFSESLVCIPTLRFRAIAPRKNTGREKTAVFDAAGYNVSGTEALEAELLKMVPIP